MVRLMKILINFFLFHPSPIKLYESFIWFEMHLSTWHGHFVKEMFDVLFLRQLHLQFWNHWPTAAHAGDKTKPNLPPFYSWVHGQLARENKRWIFLLRKLKPNDRIMHVLEIQRISRELRWWGAATENIQSMM